MPKSKVDKQKCPEISSEVFNSLVSVENQNTEAEKNMDLDNMPGESSQAKNMHTLIAPNEGQVSEIIALKMEDETQKIVKALQTLPGAGDDRISKIIENQNVLFAKQTEDLALLNQRYLAAEMKVQLIKKALKKARDHKIDDSAIKLVNFEIKEAKKERKQYKRLIKKENQSLKNAHKIIALLETIK
jgi:hypothetical protein